MHMLAFRTFSITHCAHTHITPAHGCTKPTQLISFTRLNFDLRSFLLWLCWIIYKIWICFLMDQYWSVWRFRNQQKVSPVKEKPSLIIKCKKHSEQMCKMIVYSSDTIENGPMWKYPLLRPELRLIFVDCFDRELFTKQNLDKHNFPLVAELPNRCAPWIFSSKNISRERVRVSERNRTKLKFISAYLSWQAEFISHRRDKSHRSNGNEVYGLLL